MQSCNVKLHSLHFLHCDRIASEPKKVEARVLQSAVLPTPVGPQKQNLSTPKAENSWPRSQENGDLLDQDVSAW